MIEFARPVPAALWNGQSLVAALTAASDWLTANRDRVNALNVFPVPDGDTGTNMALTLQAAIAEAQKLSAHDRRQASEVATAAAYGALMGARGNSGVILSQILRGFAHGIGGRTEIDGQDLARALAEARDMAYRAVMRPVEGTMLTVARAAEEHAARAAERTPSVTAVLAAALAGAREALIATPQQLDVLLRAGVVDAGGQGLVVIFEGMDCAARGEPIPTEAPAVVGPLGAEMAFLDRVEEMHGDDAFGYCTNFMIFGQEIDFPRARDELAELGTSTVIVGDVGIIKVHIHTPNPGTVLERALKWGELGHIRIDNMNLQMDTLVEQRQAGTNAAAPASAYSVGRQAVLAVASGRGLADALRSMGSTGIIDGGSTMNPSVEELLDAVERTPSDEVILLPNNPNILMAAHHVPELTRKRVRIVPSSSVPQGIAALAAFNANADLRTNLREMTAAMTTVQTVEITIAEKDANIDGLTVARGQAIGLLDSRLVASGPDLVDVACQALSQVNLAAAELVTIFTGEGAREHETKQIDATLTRRHPQVTVEIYRGDQSHYPYLIAVE